MRGGRKTAILKTAWGRFILLALPGLSFIGYLVLTSVFSFTFDFSQGLSFISYLIGTPQSASSFDPPMPAQTAAPGAVTFIGAGDISDCGHKDTQITADILSRFPDAAIFIAGDASNDQGTLRQFQKCFDPYWGHFKPGIRPAIGNHDYGPEGPMGYFSYFGAAAGEPGKGYYSYDLGLPSKNGAWHIIVLNSECPEAGGCTEGSPQEAWLKADLAAHPARCSIAIWHEPRFTSGIHGNYPIYTDFWKDLYAAGVEIILNGHDHNYERFAPQDPIGNADPQNGIREFVVGTGGAQLSPLRYLILRTANSQKAITGVYGLLKLDLSPDHYDWEFIAGSGNAATDSGSEACH